MIYIPLNLVRCVLWSRMSVLVNVPCVLEENMYSAVVWGSGMLIISNFDSVVEFGYVISDPLPARSIHFW